MSTFPPRLGRRLTLLALGLLLHVGSVLAHAWLTFADVLASGESSWPDDPTRSEIMLGGALCALVTAVMFALLVWPVRRWLSPSLARWLLLPAYALLWLLSAYWVTDAYVVLLGNTWLPVEVLALILSTGHATLPALLINGLLLYRWLSQPRSGGRANLLRPTASNL